MFYILLLHSRQLLVTPDSSFDTNISDTVMDTLMFPVHLTLHYKRKEEQATQQRPTRTLSGDPSYNLLVADILKPLKKPTRS